MWLFTMIEAHKEGSGEGPRPGGEKPGFAGGSTQELQHIQLPSGQVDDGLSLGALPGRVREDEEYRHRAIRRTSKQMGMSSRTQPGKAKQAVTVATQPAKASAPQLSLVDLENAALEKKEEQMMALVRQGQEQKRRLDLTIMKQKDTIGNLSNELKVVMEEVKSSKGAQLVAHRHDMEAIINQNMGLLQRHQEMLRNIPHALKECGKQNMDRQRAVDAVEEQTRVQIRKLDGSHVVELSKLKEQYELFKTQNEQVWKRPYPRTHQLRGWTY